MFRWPGGRRERLAWSTVPSRDILAVPRSRRCCQERGQLLAGFELTWFEVPGEPTVDLVVSGAEIARGMSAEAILGCGGGSAMDAGKAIAALATNRGDVFDYADSREKLNLRARASIAKNSRVRARQIEAWLKRPRRVWRAPCSQARPG